MSSLLSISVVPPFKANEGFPFDSKTWLMPFGSCVKYKNDFPQHERTHS